jgi:hypothetical protein
LTSLLAEIGLNIQEAHAFSTVDGFSLDVFVVDGWLREVWSYSFHQLEKSSVSYFVVSACYSHDFIQCFFFLDCLKIKKKNEGNIKLV